MSVLGSAIRRERGDPSVDPIKDLAAYLAGEYRVGVPWRLTVRHPAASGYELSDRMVSRLEVAHALALLPHRQRRVVELLYQDDLPAAQVADRLGVSVRTVWADRLDALAAMVRVIYR